MYIMVSNYVFYAFTFFNELHNFLFKTENI